jgi:solute carrier family 35 protein E3
MLLSASGVCGFLINWTSFLVMGETSALTHVLLGQLKTCVVIWCGFLFFAQVPSARSLLGAAIVVVSVVVYTKFNLNEQNAKRKLAENTAAQNAEGRLLGRMV